MRPGANSAVFCGVVRHLSRVLARVAVAAYAAVLLAAPVAHDVADHVQSKSQCQVCTARPQAARIEPCAAASVPPLAAAGEVPGPCRSGFVSPVPGRTSGRSPPA
jgi:hypothetical protein